MLSQKAELLTAKPVRFLKDGNSRDVHQFVHLEQDRVHVAAFPALNELDIQEDEIAQAGGPPFFVWRPFLFCGGDCVRRSCAYG